MRRQQHVSSLICDDLSRYLEKSRMTEFTQYRALSIAPAVLHTPQCRCFIMQRIHGSFMCLLHNFSQSLVVPGGKCVSMAAARRHLPVLRGEIILAQDLTRFAQERTARNLIFIQDKFKTERSQRHILCNPRDREKPHALREGCKTTTSAPNWLYRYMSATARGENVLLYRSAPPRLFSLVVWCVRRPPLDCSILRLVVIDIPLALAYRENMRKATKSMASY